ncbi:MAG: murein transglycosylase, partial [Flavobacteriaceae bacterium]|nr:murein transglycosylase [Flavobacteriaceae bacterium]
RSLAVDRKYLALGLPLWLETELPGVDGNPPTPTRRLVIAQDTGGAIKGVVRGDLFIGTGDAPGEIAGRMQEQGRYWVLLPRPRL